MALGLIAIPILASRALSHPASTERDVEFQPTLSHKLKAGPGTGVRSASQTGSPAKGHTFGSFWKVGGGYATTLILRNKDSQNPIMANIVLFSHSGIVEQNVPIELAPNAASRLSLNDIVKPGGDPVHWGGLMIELPNVSASLVIGNVIVENQKGVIFDLPLSGGYRYDTENSLHAPWWLIDQGTDGTVTLFNQSDQDIVVSPSIVAQGTERTAAALGLAPHETRQIRIRELLRQQDMEADRGSIALRYTGPAHALNPALLLANQDTGFSLVSPFNARRDNVEFGQALWRFPDVFLSADSRLGFNSGEKLTAHAIVSNPTKSPLSPQLTAYVSGAEDTSQKFTLPIAVLNPLETRVINLSQFVASGLLPANAPYISLALAHKGVPGSVGLAVFTVGQNKNFVSRSPGLVRSGQIIDSSYWDISGYLQALLVVQNAKDASVQSKATLYYETDHGTASFSLPPISVPGNGSRILNLKQIILSGTPDSAGNVIPANTTFGSLTLEVSDKASHGLIFGGTVTFDPVNGQYGLPALPPDCSLCGFCEVCVQPTDTGGVCEPDCTDPTCCPPPPPGPPDHLQVISDVAQTWNCPSSTVIRTITYAVVDINDIQVPQRFFAMETFDSISQNTCGNGTPITDKTCGDAGFGGFTDSLGVGCNAVGGDCGVTLTNQRWFLCDGTFIQPIGSPGTIVGHNDFITVGGSAHFFPGTDIFP
jgi:hypothetical protein